ncbi:hypothetical protein ACWGN5_03700 [Streptomyces sp. NPDC055815]
MRIGDGVRGELPARATGRAVREHLGAAVIGVDGKPLPHALRPLTALVDEGGRRERVPHLVGGLHAVRVVGALLDHEPALPLELSRVHGGPPPGQRVRGRENQATALPRSQAMYRAARTVPGIPGDR